MNQKMKAMLLEMLRWFHGYCEANDLRYYAQGGTMLGAVRHQGFIPWDDDVDIGMPRADYVRLGSLLAQNPHPRYCLEMPDTEAGDFFYPFAKLYDTQTTLVENTRCQIRRGIYLDIFPLDGVGSSKWEAVRHFSAVKWRRKLLLAMTTGLRQGRKPGKNLAVWVLGRIPDRLVDRKALLCAIDRISASRSFEESAWVGNLMGTWLERELVPRTVYGGPTRYSFEGLVIYGPADAGGYLTSLYGDWRQLPPVEQRRSRHDFVYLDLERSYLAQ